MPDRVLAMPSKLRTLLALCSIAIAILYVARKDWPSVPPGSIYGEYINPCCAPILINENVIGYRSESTEYNIAEDKWGTKIMPDRAIGNFYVIGADHAKSPSIFLIRKTDSQITLATVDNKNVEIIFRKIQNRN